MFTFLRLQLKTYYNGQQAYKLTKKNQIALKTTTVWCVNLATPIYKNS